MEFKLRKLLLILFIFSLFIISCEKDEVKSCNTTCSDVSTCAEAYEALNNGCSDLDRDNDGVPCESICPGG